jgi:hypothetical protein
VGRARGVRERQEELAVISGPISDKLPVLVDALEKYVVVDGNEFPKPEAIEGILRSIIGDDAENLVALYDYVMPGET